MRIEAIADIHIGLESQGIYKERFRNVSEHADILIIAGDLTQTGTREEAEVLRDELSVLSIPCVCVLGNHDYEKNQHEDIMHILSTGQICVLQGTHKVINGVGFAGVKGFIGGFGNHLLPMWGEQQIKDIVQHGINEALQLENALSLLDTPKKVVVMHYSPIVQTVIGEPPEIYAFLGSSRFEDVIKRMKATVVFHGHAHNGTFEGKIETGEEGKSIPVFNVSEHVLVKNKKENFVYEI
jgi:Icc-related predicted phosphoesterase